MAKTLKPLLWFRVRTDDGLWGIYLATVEMVPELVDAEGITFFETRHIVIDASLPEREQDETLLHELLHVGFFGLKPYSYKQEERAVAWTSPRLWPVLKRLGLRWPERPRRYEALRSER